MKPTTTRFLLFGGVPVLLAAAVVTASPANADSIAYLNDLNNAGIINNAGPEAMVSVGYQVCEQLSAGTPSREVAANALYNSDDNNVNGIDPAQADDIVNYAMLDLCPDAPGLPAT